MTDPCACGHSGWITAFEIAATLKFLGVPPAEHDEFMAVIEHYRPEIVAQTPVEQEGTLQPAGA